MPEKREDVEVTPQQDTAPDTSQQKKKWRAIDWIAGGTFIAEVLWGSWWLVTQFFQWCTWNPKVSAEHFAQFYCGVGLGILSVGYLVLILWPTIFKQGKNSKQDNDPRWFHARILSSGIVGGSYAFLLPAVMSLPEGGVNSGGAAALRQAILLATGGLIGLVALGETRRKNDNDREAAEKLWVHQQNTLDQQKNHFEKQLEKQQEQFETNAFKERKAERRERYTNAVEQLGDEKAPIRMGGVYTLVGLVDEWLEEESIEKYEDRLKEGQVIINNLCAYIRSPFTLASHYNELSNPTPTPKGIYKDKKEKFYADKATLDSESDVRLSIIKEIHDRLQGPEENTPGTWSDFEYDFSGSTFFYTVDLTKSYYKKPINFSGSTYQSEVYFTDSTYQGEADFTGSTYQSRADFGESTYEKNVIFSTFASRSAYEGGADFTGSTYKGWADFTGSTYKGWADFTDSIYKGWADFTDSTYQSLSRFSGCTYQGRADFSGCTYQGRAEFDGSTYQDSSRFSDCTYQGWADFTGSTYQGEADFHNSTYRNSAIFYRSTYNKRVNFSNSTYSGWTDFTDSTYPDWADFSSSTYGGQVKFTGSAYQGDVNFSGSIYQGQADFCHSVYRGQVVFRGSTYQSEVDFCSSTYPDWADFSGSVYRCQANFSCSSYQGEADFYGSIYRDQAIFRGSTYEGWANFSRSFYQGEADFNRSFYQGEADFHNSTYGNSAIFSRSTYNKRVNFSNSTYSKWTNFMDSAYQSWTDFRGSTYRGRADFMDSTYQDEANFSGSIFYSDTSFVKHEDNISFSHLIGRAPQFYNENNRKNTLFGSPNNNFTVDTNKGCFITLTPEGLPLSCNFLTTKQQEYLADKFQEIEKINNKLLEAKDEEENTQLLDTLGSLKKELDVWRERVTTVKVEGTAPGEEDN